MDSSQRSRGTISVRSALVAGATQFPLVAILAIAACLPIVPLTYDEAWNYLHVSSRGAASAFLTYDAPNNHTLFSMVQALLPAALVEWWPPLLRLPNLIVVAAILTLAILFVRPATLSQRVTVGIGLALCSPLFTLYLVIGRGYLLGTLLLLSSIMLLSRLKRPAFAGVLAGLAAGTVPTFGYAVPGLLAASAWRLSWRSSLPFAATFLATCGAFYGHRLARVLSERIRTQHDDSVWDMVQSTAGVVGNGVTSSSVALGLVAVALILHWRSRTRRIPPDAVTEIALLASSVASFFLVSISTEVSGFAEAPFNRAALFVPPIVWLIVLRAADDIRGWYRQVSVAALAGNAVIGGWLLFAHFGGTEFRGEGYPFYGRLGATPIERSLNAAPLRSATALESRWRAGPVTELYGRMLRLPFQEVEGGPAGCGVGSVEPLADGAVWAVVNERRIPVCY